MRQSLTVITEKDLPGLALQLAGLAVVGLTIVMLVGFAPMETLHSIAHDARHAFGFPCH